MDISNNQWTQEFGGLKPVGEIASNTCSKPVVQDGKVRPQKDQALNCPRCHSTNTKFCYYNNYSLTQPRYFCKACRRYWTEGGTLRNVPVGGGSRKSKRSTTTISTSASSSHKLPDLDPPNSPHFVSPNPIIKIHPQYPGQDLNLGFPATHDYMYQLKSSSSSSSGSTSTPFAALELPRTGIVPRVSTDSFLTSTAPATDLNAVYTSRFAFQDLKPEALSFSFDHGIGSRYVNVPSVIQENGVRLMFPLESIKQVPSTREVDQNKGQPNSNGYWNGMLGGKS